MTNAFYTNRKFYATFRLVFLKWLAGAGEEDRPELGNRCRKLLKEHERVVHLISLAQKETFYEKENAVRKMPKKAREKQKFEKDSATLKGLQRKRRLEKEKESWARISGSRPHFLQF